MAGVLAELRLGGTHALKAVQRLVQSERVETVLAPELLRLISTGTPDLAVPSFLALAKLCSNSDLHMHPHDTFDSKVTALSISNYLESSDIRMQAAATLALSNLTQQNMALEETILSRVVDAIENNQHEGIQNALLGYIGNASTSSEATKALIQDTNCMAVLSELIQSGRGEVLRGAAALAIGNLLTNRDIFAQNQLRETGSLSDLVLLLSQTYTNETNECAAWALSHAVHQNVLSQDLVGDAGAISLLLKLCVSPDEDVRRNGIMALYSCVIGHQDNIDRCTRNHGKAIMDDLLHDEIDECREYAALLLKEI